MRIALFGSNSSITQDLKKVLANCNEIITLGRSNADVIVDINDIPKNFELPQELDTLVLSATHYGGHAIYDYFDAINVNVIGTLKLLNLAISANVKHFIYISSIYSHFKATDSNSSIYSISKKFSEEVLLKYADGKQIKLTIIRPTQIIGDYDSNKKNQPFLYSFLSNIKNSENIIFHGKHNPKRNFIFIRDLSIILHQVIIRQVTGVFDCAHPTNTSFLEIANYAKNIFKSRSCIFFDESKNDLSDNVLDYNYDLFNLINYIPKTSIFEAIEKIASKL